jgi:hypothetical protein
LTAHVPIVDSYQGRGATAIIEIAQQRLVVRRFRPGGLLRGIRPPTFGDPKRPFEELFLYEYLRRRRIPTLRPVAAIARRIGRRYALELITEELARARDLLALLLDETLARGRRAQILRAAGQAVARLHGAGIWHADMHLKNFLIQEGRVHVIDLDRSRLIEELPFALRVANLVRLWRYTDRRRRGDPRLAIERGDALRFLRGYEPERGPRQRLMRVCSRRYRRSLPLHRLGWFLEALLHRSPASGTRS